ncbi:MAG: Rqc2 family fibronectin-binding protein, partial [Enterococcus lemanii]
PDTPPNFVMLLRKHLDGAILQTIEQVENDRIVHFTFSHRDELGDLESLVLVVELMGRHSTILLLNQANNKILEAIKHIGPSQNTYRSILPGSTYAAPPKQNRLNPFTATQEEIFQQLSQLNELKAKNLQQIFQGLGSDTAKELEKQLQKQPNNKLKVWQQFFEKVKQPKPVMMTTESKEFFTPFLFESILNQETKVVEYPTLSSLLDGYYQDKAERDRVKQQGNELIKRLYNEIKRNEAKLEKRQKTLLEAEQAEILRQKGELLTTYLHQVPRGESTVTLENYYEENQPIVIALNPAFTPNQNAQKYFQRYQKLRNARKLLDQQIAETTAEINYLHSVLAQVEIATPMDLDLIKEELMTEGYLKRPTTKQRKNTKKSQPEVFYANDHTEILVGRNNLQNDQLTLKTARKTDYWLHTKDIPGSHVIIKSANPSEETILEAAEIAAYYSKYRHSARVPVDLVQVKHIRKPNGSKPGYVIYENQTTYFVTPKEERIQKFKERKN